ncbi:MFS transporter [Bosea thiooxidans]|nr:MFS transporter [Bosea sp. (in: a-proteobacteria)]
MATAFLSRIPPTIAPILAVERGWSDSIVGYLASLNTLGSIIFLALGAPFLRALGSVRALQVGLMIGILGLALFLPSWTITACIAALLIGVGYGPSSPAGNDILHRTAPLNRRSLIFSIKQAGVPLGGVVAGLALPPLTALYGWRVALLISAVFVLAIVFSVQPMREGLDQDRERDLKFGLGVVLSLSNLVTPVRTLTASSSLFRLAAAGACLAVGQGIWFAYLMTYAVSELGYTLKTAGVLYALMQATSVAGRVLLGGLSDRLGVPRLLLRVIGLASGITSLTLALATPEWSFRTYCIIAAIAGVTVSSWNGVQLSEIARACPPTLVREASAAATLVIFLGYVVAPSLFAMVLSLTARFDLGLFACALSGLICFFVVPQEND